MEEGSRGPPGDSRDTVRGQEDGKSGRSTLGAGPINREFPPDHQALEGPEKKVRRRNNVVDFALGTEGTAGIG